MFREIVQRHLGPDPSIPSQEGEGLQVTLDISRVDEKTHRLWGWAYISRDKDGNQIKDRKNAICPTEVLEEAVYEFNRRDVRPSGDMHGTDDDGTVIQHGWIVESMVFTREKCDAMGIPPGTLPEGWWVCAEVPESSECWAAVKRGERAHFSLSGQVFADYME